MFTLVDNPTLYQWDLNRKLLVAQLNVTEVHFCNGTDDCALVVNTVIENNRNYAYIPNILLQSALPIKAYAYVNDSYTAECKCFKVTKRNKPSDYAYTETEIKSYEYLDAKLTQIEEIGFSEETVGKAVTGYMYAHPLSITDDGEGNVLIEMINDGQEVKY